MKLEILSRILDVQNPKLTVVFCNTKKMVDDLTAGLQSRGYFADGLHGDLKQIQRDGVMNKFRNSTIDILVATDVAARGIDVDDVDLVINYDMPQDVEYYVHRIGRTARAGREGTAISFVSPREMNTLSQIQKYTKTKIEKRDMPTLKDLIKRHEERFMEDIKEEINKNEHTKELNLINILMSEDYSPIDIAACLLKHYNENNNIDFTIISAPNFHCVPEIDGVNSEAAIIIDFESKLAIICGTRYSGEIKKMVFCVMNLLMPDLDVLPMHCSANIDPVSGETAVFFGLSGTGKTTLSTDPNRKLIGDDEHGWSDHGIFNFEGGCYAKCINLKEKYEPEIYHAINFGGLVENVVMIRRHRNLTLRTRA